MDIWSVGDQAADLDSDEVAWEEMAEHTDHFGAAGIQLVSTAGRKLSAANKGYAHLFQNPGCAFQGCNRSNFEVVDRPSTGKAAWMMSLCDVQAQHEDLAHLSCDTHDVFLVNKCKPVKHTIPDQLQSCTSVLDWSWCFLGYNHCTNFFFLVHFYDRLSSWDAVYFLKGRHNGQSWKQSNIDFRELSTRFKDEDIGYEDYANKIRPWSSTRAGKPWIPVLKKMSCGWPAKHARWMGAPRNNFLVSTSRLLSWPQCKYQWLLHLTHFPPKGISRSSMKAVWEFFEHTYGILFSCRPQVTADWQPKGGFPGLHKPHYVCHNSSVVSIV